MPNLKPFKYSALAAVAMVGTCSISNPCCDLEISFRKTTNDVFTILVGPIDAMHASRRYIALPSETKLDIDWARKNTIIIDAIDQQNDFAKIQMLCLALNVYHEAQGAADTDLFAVALVTRNRVNLNETQQSYCDVIYQYSWDKGHKKKVAQFSWTNMPKLRAIRDTVSWEKAQKIAYLIYTDTDYYDFTRGATNFYNPKHANPAWAHSKKYQETLRLPTHRFLASIN